MSQNADDSVQADLRSYYEHEAQLGTRTEVRGMRVALRDEFVELLRTEHCRSVVDLGSGPGLDGVTFAEAGLRYVGIDLAHGNGVLAAHAGLSVVQGSIARPPLRPGSFDAGWSMSTFMHVPAEEAAAVAAGMVAPVRAGGPLLVGLWGGTPRDEIDDTMIIGERRLFSLRSVDHNRQLLGAGGDVQHRSTFDVGPDDWEYQVFLIRAS
jgi:SAM-dependent methyltransferase